MKYLSILVIVGIALGFVACIQQQPNRKQLETITFAQHIGPFVFEKCSGCHNALGAGTYSFTNYREISGSAEWMLRAMEEGIMPPWKPDPTYTSFAHELTITNQEIAAFRTWITEGKPTGDTTQPLMYQKVDFERQQYPNTFTFSLRDTFVHPGDGKDHYENMVLDIPTQQEMLVSAIEIVPSNYKIFHHAWLLAVPENMNIEDLGDPAQIMHIKPIAGYLPGMSINPLPQGYVKRIPKGYKFILNVHYGHSYKQEVDVPSLVFHFAKKKHAFKEVSLAVIMENTLTEKPFIIKANTQKTFELNYTLPVDIEVLSVAPHMHHVGKTYTAFAITPNRDTIKLIRILDWDFNMQNLYYFKNPVFIPKGSKIIVQALFDNTIQNKRNPFLPPQDIIHGERSMDEMLELFLEVSTDCFSCLIPEDIHPEL